MGKGPMLDARTVNVRVNGRNLHKDSRSKHLDELVQGARSPKRGRRRGSVTKAKASTARKPAARKAASRKGGRPRSARQGVTAT